MLGFDGDCINRGIDECLDRVFGCIDCELDRAAVCSILDMPTHDTRVGIIELFAVDHKIRFSGEQEQDLGVRGTCNSLIARSSGSLPRCA